MPNNKTPKIKTPNNKTPKNKTPNATNRPMQQNAQCNKTPNAIEHPITKHPMLQKAQPQKNAQILKNVKKS